MKLNELVSVLKDGQKVALQVNNKFKDGGCSEGFTMVRKDGVLIGDNNSPDFGKSDYEYYEDCEVVKSGTMENGNDMLWISIRNYEDGSIDITDPNANLSDGDNELRERWESRAHVED